MNKIVEKLLDYVPRRKLLAVLAELCQGEVVKIKGITFAIINGELIFDKNYEMQQVFLTWKGLSIQFSPQYVNALREWVRGDFKSLPEITLSNESITKMLDFVNPEIKLIRWKGVSGIGDIINCCVTFEGFMECLKWIRKNKKKLQSCM